MASTYSSNLKMELIGSGEQAGAWGTTTNKNWEKTEESSSAFAQVTITQPVDATGSDPGWNAAAGTYNWTLSDTADAYTPNSASVVGSSGRAAFVEFTGTPTKLVTVNIRGNSSINYPNRVMFVKNSVVGGFDLSFDANGTDFLLKNGAVAAIYTEPGVAVGNVFDSMQVGSGTAGLVLANGSIKSLGGTVNFDDDDITTTGDITAAQFVGPATSATNVGVTAIGTAASHFVGFVAASTGNEPIGADAGLKYNPSTNRLSVTGAYTTTGAVDLVLDTNGGTDSGTITITDAANGDITLDPDGTGSNVLTGNFTLNGTGSGSKSLSGVSAGRNVLIGESAGTSLTIGSTGGLIAIGTNAATNITSGGNTVAIGKNACGGLTTGGQNVGIGHEACGGDTGVAPGGLGNNNVCIGELSGSDIRDGTLNTFIGSATGVGLTSGSSNTCIGNLATPSLATATNQIVIGTLISSQGNSTITIGQTLSTSSLAFGSTVWGSPSDSRVKKNVLDNVIGLPFIESLRPISYEFKQPEDMDGSEDPEVVKACSYTLPDGTVEGKPSGTRWGFIAQEVKESLDSNSIDIKDGGWNVGDDGIQQVGESAFIPSLVKAIQELSGTVDSLSARIAELEGNA